MPLLSGIWGRGREQFHFIRFMSTPFWVSSNRDSWRNMLLPSRAATLWLWHCGAPKANEMIHVVLRARGGKRDRMRDPVMCPSPAPTANCLLFQYWELDCAKLHPCSQVLPSLCTGNFIQSQLVQWACLRVRLGSGAVGFYYHNRILTMQYAPSRPSRQKPEPVCYYHMAACVVRFPHSLKHFVFCQSGAHFASPWQGQVYFLLGLNIFGSQMKETVPRESFRFPQIIREGVCAHAIKVLRDCFSLIKEVETQTELSRTQGYGWSSFSGPSLCFSLSGWAGSFHILGAGSCYIHLWA